MTREQYESLPLAELKEIAKARGMKGTSAMKKGDLIERMLEKDKEAEAQKEKEAAGSAEHHGRTERTERRERAERPQSRQEYAERTERSMAERGERAERQQQAAPQDMASLDSGQVVTGILEVLGDGYGFIRSDNYLPGENDIYINPQRKTK